MEVDIIPLDGHRYLIEVEDRSDVFGPLSKRELIAIYETLEEFLEEGY